MNEAIYIVITRSGERIEVRIDAAVAEASGDAISYIKAETALAIVAAGWYEPNISNS